MPTPLVQRALSSGELAPAFGTRADLPRYHAGLKRCRNFVVRSEGGAENRPGTAFVCEVKDSTKRTYLATFVYTPDQAYVIEAGDFYFRFIRLGAQLEDPPATPYEISTPYAVADLPELYASQRGAVVTLTHHLYAPRELTRTGHTAWTLTTITTAPTIAAPGPVTHAGELAGQENRWYVATSVKTETYEESVASAPDSVIGCAEPTAIAPITLSWPGVAGAVEYRVYAAPYGTATEPAGAFGYIGTTKDLSFNDAGFVPDFGRTPPIARVLFNAVGQYPAISGTYQQRRLFASTDANPETIYASRIGFPSNFSISSPLQDDDAVTWVTAARGFQPPRHLIDLKQLLVLTGAGEFKVRGDGEGGALKPTAINPDQQGYTGASPVAPVVYGQAVIFVSARGSLVRDLRFDAQLDGIGSRNLTTMASHLFKRKTITRLVLQQAPRPVTWAIRSDGALLGLTYEPEHDVYAWHRHDTGNGDAFEDVCVVPEGDEDAVYVVVRRTIEGVTKRYIERFASRQIETWSTDAWFVDSGVSYSGAPTVTITGLDHLEGRTVTVLADGVVPAPGTWTVSAGRVVIAVAAANIRVGLPITAQLETLEIDVQGSDVRDRRKAIPGVTIVVEDSARNFAVGPSVAKLTTVRAEVWDTAAAHEGAVEAKIDTSWSPAGRVLLQHTQPTPLTVLAVIPNVQVGG